MVTSESIKRTQQHADSTKLPVPGLDRANNAFVSILLSLRIIPPCQRKYDVCAWKNRVVHHVIKKAS